VTVNRREVMRLGAGLGMACALPWGAALSQPRGLIKKPIPSSGELLTPIGIGTNRYSVGRGEDARAPLRATLALFHELGGQVVDTAEEYGDSEAVIGDLADALAITDALFLATKVRMRGREAGIRSIEQSLRRLRRDPVDLMQIHDLIDYQTHIETLRALKAQGRIRYLGITTSRTGQHAELERIMAREDLDFVQLSYSIDDRAAAERLLPLAADRGMAVLVNLPFGRGGLFRAVGSRPLPDWAAEFDCSSWAQFFLKYIIAHPAVTCAIPGTRQERHVVDNMGAATGRLPDAQLRRRQEAFFDALPA
jgi:aryl-alcohol dehydrogenase-like predicted oxidoreductase